MLMPPPFSQRHASYLQHYKDTGEVKILDSVKEVVALSKVRVLVEDYAPGIPPKGSSHNFQLSVKHY